MRQIVLYGLNICLNYVESPCSCYYFIRSLEMKKVRQKPKTGGFVLFSSSELRPGSGRSKASLQNRNLEEYWILNNWILNILNIEYCI